MKIGNQGSNLTVKDTVARHVNIGHQSKCPCNTTCKEAVVTYNLFYSTYEIELVSDYFNLEALDLS